MTRLPALLAGALALSACDSDPIDPTPEAAALYVGNQGNFSDDSGSLTRYDLATEAVVQDAIPDLGGLVQNLYSTGTRLYVLLNFGDSFTTGSGRIDIVSTVSGERTGQIDVKTPRAFSTKAATSLGPAEVYVTNLYAGTVTPVNVPTGEAGDPIAVGAAPEGVVSVAGRTYVANSGFGAGTTLSVFDTDFEPASGDTVGTVEGVCQGPRTLLADRDLDVWVVCTGQTDFETNEVTGGAVVVLDGATGRVVERFSYDEILGSATFGVDATYVPATEEVYVIADGAVLRFDAEANAFEARIEVAGAAIGAVAYDDGADRLYLGRPNAGNPFGADGVVTIHDRAGAEVGRFPAGIAPAALAFASAEPIAEG